MPLLGWPPTWRKFRELSAGWGCFGTWTFLLITAGVIFSILLSIAMFVGLFTGIQRYNEAKRIVANGPQMLAELQEGMSSPRISGMQG